MNETCKTCNGVGSIMFEISNMECCFKSTYECGGRGCSGPEQRIDYEPDVCPECHGEHQPTDKERP